MVAPVNPVGIMAVVLGLLLICLRGPLLVAPRPWLQWFAARLGSDRRIRLFGAGILVLCVAMVAAGSTDRSTLAIILTIWGLIGILLSPWLLFFPGSFGRFASSLAPKPDARRFPGWRSIGALNIAVGCLLVYFGARAI